MLAGMRVFGNPLLPDLLPVIEPCTTPTSLVTDRKQRIVLCQHKHGGLIASANCWSTALGNFKRGVAAGQRGPCAHAAIHKAGRLRQ